MSLHEGQQVELAIEKPASGGRMIARHLGQIVLVRGAIPGERVRAWVERAEKRMAYAVVREIVEASPDRRADADDPLCGGALYSHIAYARQLAIKSDVIRDAFGRLGHQPLDAPVAVAASPEEGYRMRARFHVRGGRAGFYREGTHQLCDAGPTRQLRADAVRAVEALAASLEREAPGAAVSIAVAENIAADERAADVELRAPGTLGAASLERARHDAGIRGLTARSGSGAPPLTVGEPVVRDPLAAITGNPAAQGAIQRHADAFFQGNRFLLADLVAAVAREISGAGEILDLYAGVGLFSVALAALGHAEVTAVEGDRASAADLRENARGFEPRLRVAVASVEEFLARRQRAVATLLLDPPRTGVSKDAAAGILRLAPPTLVYVSCDPPTLARDARRFLDAGYTLDSLRAFDFFPNTPHVECLAVFTRRT